MGWVGIFKRLVSSLARFADATHEMPSRISPTSHTELEERSLR